MIIVYCNLKRTDKR